MHKLSLFLVATFISFGLYAGNGDTIKVKPHDKTHLNWFGDFDRWGKFPDATKKFNRIWMKFTLGCPGSGCSEWDYTTNVFVRKRTGKMDSSLKTYPTLKVNGNKTDSVWISQTPTYRYVFNAVTKETDSVKQDSMLLELYEDPADFAKLTQSITAWPANYYKYLYDSTGQKIDSVFQAADAQYKNQDRSRYEQFEIIDNYELARLITPYNGGVAVSWTYTYVFDVTDYTMLLRDSAEIRVSYSGYQDGFTATVDFEFIEGTPAREVTRIDLLYNGSFPYGDPNNSIENFLTSKQIPVAVDADKVMLRVIQTGHGFGGNENCAEFCSKEHYVKVNGSPKYTTAVWRDNCGLNPIFPQAGTWLYDRANWCPGADVIPYKYDLTPYINKGSSNTIDLDMESFVNAGNNFCSYIVSAHAIHYKSNAYSNDVSLEEIINPNTDARFKRENPACGNPKIKVKSHGSTAVTSLQIRFGVNAATMSTYNWTGNIAEGEEREINLPQIDFSQGSSNAFEAEIVQVNGNADEVTFNNKKISAYQHPKVFPPDFVLWLTTNNIPQDNKLVITNEDQNGAVVFQKENMSPNTTYRDTVHLINGCYKLVLTDASKTGLDFWAMRQQEGSGAFSIRRVTNVLLQSFNPDFGTSIVFYFTVGFNLSIEDQERLEANIFPNPATRLLNVRTAAKEGHYRLLDMSGKLLREDRFVQDEFTVDVETLAQGVYYLKIEVGGKTGIFKIVK